MKRYSAASVALFRGVGGCAPAPPEPNLPSDDHYEELPQLKASEILRGDMLAGPHHTVREEVTTCSGANRFTIADFGVLGS
jgi:hypothetical protein